jgi:multimeric flavodoxin WrbA
MRFSRKIGAAVSAVRRAGAVHTLDSIIHFYHINDMIVPGSTYLNMSLSLRRGDYEKDEEGINTMTRLGENIVWLLEKLK